MDTDTIACGLAALGALFFYASVFWKWGHAAYSLSHALVSCLWFFFLLRGSVATGLERGVEFHVYTIQSMVYFATDTLYCVLVSKNKLWIFHHTVAIFLEGLGMLATPGGAAEFLYLSEVGGLFYHISRAFPQSLLARTSFVGAYGVSRFNLVTGSWIFVDNYLVAASAAAAEGGSGSANALYLRMIVFLAVTICIMNMCFLVLHVRAWLTKVRKTLFSHTHDHDHDHDHAS
jgi:hypothetical protein